MTRFKNLPLCISVSFFLLAILIFAAIRLALLLLNPEIFTSLTKTEIVASFWYGLRFDLSIISLFLGPVIVLLNLPVYSKKWIKFWAGFLLIELTVMTGFLIGDLIYFPKVTRHMAEEIIQLTHDWGFIVSYMFRNEWLPLILLLGILGGMLFFLFKCINRYYRPIKRVWWKEGLKIFVLIALCILGIRGKVTGKSLGVADVYNFTSTAEGAALTLNGLFSSYQVARKGAVALDNPYPAELAVTRAQELLIPSDEVVPDSLYPLMRRAAQKEVEAVSTPNIFIVMLEGWHPHYIDGLSHQNLGLTPEFDKIIQNGISFTNAYAAGQRSIIGFSAILAGIPQVPGLPLFGYGLEMTSIAALPRFFSDAGYYTFFAQTSLRGSFRLCALASYLGMQETYGWEDMPTLLTYNQQAPFGYDYEALLFAADKIKNRPAGKPFFTMVFTGITHEPFTSTLPQFDKYPYDSLEHGLMNTLGYADWSIGQLLEQAKKDGWFDDTIFVFVSDHSARVRRLEHEDLQSQFQIPLVLYSPKYLKPKRIDKVVSQMDLMPTLLKLAHLNPTYTSLGRDLLDDVPHVAFVSTGVNIGLVSDAGAVRVGGGKILAADSFSSHVFDEKQMQNDLFAIEKAMYTLLKQNHWYAPQGGSHD